MKKIQSELLQVVARIETLDSEILCDTHCGKPLYLSKQDSQAKFLFWFGKTQKCKFFWWMEQSCIIMCIVAVFHTQYGQSYVLFSASKTLLAAPLQEPWLTFSTWHNQTQMWMKCSSLVSLRDQSLTADSSKKVKMCTCKTTMYRGGREGGILMHSGYKVEIRKNR